MPTLALPMEGSPRYWSPRCSASPRKRRLPAGQTESSRQGIQVSITSEYFLGEPCLIPENPKINPIEDMA